MSLDPYCFQTYDFTADDLTDLGEIGRGAFGTVNKMIHKRSDTIMAVKVSHFRLNGNRFSDCIDM